MDYSGPLEPSSSILSALHLAHATHIPFENLDILLGRAILLDLDSVQAKLVKGKRGGYCFEQNRLFATVLTELGFSVTPLAARVRYRTTLVLPRTHMTLLVTVDGQTWLADVGFGAEGLLLPIPFVPGQPTTQFVWTYRLVVDAGYWVLQSLHDGAWEDLYAFTEEPQHPIDYEVANHYTSTHPESRFVHTLTAQSLTPTCRTILRNLDLVEDFGTTVTRRTVGEGEELLAVLADTFNLHFPSGTRFTYRVPIV